MSGAHDDARDGRGGAALIGLDDYSRPFLTIGLALSRGSIGDPDGLEGLSHLTAQMLARGTKTMTRPVLAEAIDHIGSSLEVSVGRDHTTLWADGLSRHRERLLTILEEVIASPSFAEDELEKLKRETLADLAAIRDDDASLGMRFFARHLYGDHAYARPLKGNETTLARIGRADLEAMHASWSVGESLVAITGDLDAAERDGVAARLTRGLARVDASEPRIGAPPATTGGWRVLVVDKPRRTQTQVFIGQLSIHARHPGWTALQVAQTSFGGTFTSRLSHEIREKRGWSYGAWSQLSGDAQLGTFMMRYYPSTKDTGPALALTHELLSEYLSTGPREDEFVAAQSNLQNGFVFAIDTPLKRLSELVSARLLGYPDDHVDRTVERLRAVSFDDAVRSLKAHIQPAHMAVTIVGTASELVDALAELPFVSQVEVVDWQAP